MSVSRKKRPRVAVMQPVADRGFGGESPMRSRWLLSVLFILGLTLGAPKASATLLFAGGEDIDFICTNVCSFVMPNGSYRAAWARGAYSVNPGASDPPASYFSTPTFTGNATIWIHAQYYQGNTNTSSGSQQIRVVDNLGNPSLIVRGTGTAGTVKISSRTSAGVFTDLVTCSATMPDTNLDQLDLYVNYSTTGEVTLYKNSVSICDYTGNVTNGDGATTITRAQFGGATSNGDWSEVIVATADTRAMARYTASTAGNGNTTGFSGTNICSAIWNVTSFNDSNFGYSGSNSVLQECTVNSSIAPGVYSVLGLVMSARALVGSTGPQHFDFLTRTANTDYASGDFAPTTSFSNITNYIQTVNPSTSNPWAVSDFQAAGFNVGEKTKP